MNTGLNPNAEQPAYPPPQTEAIVNQVLFLGSYRSTLVNGLTPNDPGYPEIAYT